MVKNKSEIISRFLSPAISLWLKSQLEEVSDLKMEIRAGDAKILRGKIEKVFLKTTKAVYQGIHVNQAHVATEKIAVNLGGILRGKPLKLLEPIFVTGEIRLSQHDLQTSLQSKLLQQGLIDLVELLLNEKGILDRQQIMEKYEFTWEQVQVFTDKFMLTGIIHNGDQEQFPLVITSHLTLENYHTLSFKPIQIEGIPEYPSFILSDFTVDLGLDVEIETLELSVRELFCQGKAKVVS